MTVSNGQLKVLPPPLTSSRVGVAIPLHGRSDMPGCPPAFHSSLPAVHFCSDYPSYPPCMGGRPTSTSGSGICEVHPEWPPMRISDWVSPLASTTVCLIQYGFSPPPPRGYRRVPWKRGVHEPDARSLFPLPSRCRTCRSISPVGPSGRSGSPALERAVQKYFDGGLAPSTHKTYTAASKRFYTFCSMHNKMSPFPVC